MRWLCLAVLLFVVPFSAFAGTKCVWVQYDIWDPDTATLNAYGYYDCWTEYDDPFPGTGPKGGGGYPEEGPPGDSNNNGIIDDWTAVVDTSDPCAYNLDWGDRLGSDYGGPNADSGVPSGETGRPHHNGVDIQGNIGDPVRSIMTGIVERANDDGTGCGLSVRVRHADGSSATYCHMSGLGEGIALGATVGASEILGEVGDTGSPDPGAYHLHLIFRDSSDTPQEFFNYAETPPQSWQLDPSGC